MALTAEMKHSLGKTYQDKENELKNILVIDITSTLPLEVFVSLQNDEETRKYFRYNALMLVGGFDHLTQAKNAAKRLVRRLWTPTSKVQASGKTIAGGHAVYVEFEREIAQEVAGE